ncbi:MAG TPA: hypothetical protein VHU81_02515 [Thermoanaerobaculia bacterium]|jgi:hypothetical protein|nr:hypothetical protein [Thermoanaerobaculia bacterium]
MRELTSVKAMTFKAGLFFLMAVLCAAGLLMANPSFATAFFVLLLAWSAARFYYFLFYVLQTYVDPSLKYSGLLSLARELAARRRRS